MDLSKVLESLTNGEISKEKAKELIHSAYAKISEAAAEVSQKEKPSEIIKESFDKIMKAKDAVMTDVNIAGMKSNLPGMTLKFSLLKSYEASRDCTVKDNLVTGCQWSGVSFSDKSSVQTNKFTATQCLQVGIQQSDFCQNQIALTRLNQLTIQEARFNENKLSRCNMEDTSITESDFTHNQITKTDFLATVINASRLARVSASDSVFKDCEFNGCDIQGLAFVNCQFVDCTFEDIVCDCAEPIKIIDRNLTGKKFQGLKSASALIDAFAEQPEPKKSNENVEKSAPKKPKSGTEKSSKAKVEAEPNRSEPKSKAKIAQPETPKSTVTTNKKVSTQPEVASSEKPRRSKPSSKPTAP